MADGGTEGTKEQEASRTDAAAANHVLTCLDVMRLPPLRSGARPRGFAFMLERPGIGVNPAHGGPVAGLGAPPDVLDDAFGFPGHVRGYLLGLLARHPGSGGPDGGRVPEGERRVSGDHAQDRS